MTSTSFINKQAKFYHFLSSILESWHFILSLSRIEGKWKPSGRKFWALGHWFDIDCWADTTLIWWFRICLVISGTALQLHNEKLSHPFGETMRAPNRLRATKNRLQNLARVRMQHYFCWDRPNTTRYEDHCNFHFFPPHSECWKGLLSAWSLKKLVQHTQGCFFDVFSASLSSGLPKFWVRPKFQLS